MTKKEFCLEIAEILEIDDELNENSDLKTYDEFDSLAIMGIVALVNGKFGKRIPGEQIQSVCTPADIMNLIGIENFD